MAKGLATVMRHLVKPSFTGAYPWEPKILPPRSRTSFVLPRGDEGIPLCKSCGLCERSCPVSAITILSEKREDGPGRELHHFEIDLGLCMFCGLCVESCPSTGIKHAGDFELAVPAREGTIAVLYDIGEVATAPARQAAPAEPAPAAPPAEDEGGASE